MSNEHKLNVIVLSLIVGCLVVLVGLDLSRARKYSHEAVREFNMRESLEAKQ